MYFWARLSPTVLPTAYGMSNGSGARSLRGLRTLPGTSVFAYLAVQLITPIDLDSQERLHERLLPLASDATRHTMDRLLSERHLALALWSWKRESQSRQAKSCG